MEKSAVNGVLLIQLTKIVGNLRSSITEFYIDAFITKKIVTIDTECYVLCKELKNNFET